MKSRKNRATKHHFRFVLRPVPALLLGVAGGSLGLTTAVHAEEQASPARVVVASAAAAQTKVSAKSATEADTAKKTQDITAQPDQPAAEIKTVNVVAQRMTELIDRSVFDLKAEVLTPNASAADVIANVPNVNVDPDGKVTIKGNSNTQVFVNGKRSAMFSGTNGGEALNSFPAAALERIEVITTPGAEFGSEGGAGPILNLVTKRVRPPGGLGVMTVTAGPEGRDGVSGNGSYSTGRFQMDGQANFNHDLSRQAGHSTMEFLVGNASWLTLRNTSTRSPMDRLSVNPTFTYNIGDTDRLGFAMNYLRTKRTSESMDASTFYHGDPLPYEQYTRAVRRDALTKSDMFALSYERKFSQDEKINFDLRNSGSVTDSSSNYRNTYLVMSPTGPHLESLSGNNSSTRLTEFSIDYDKKFSPDVGVKAGTKLGANNGRSDSDYFNIDPLTGEELVDSNLAYAFKSTERSYAFYGSADARLSERWQLQPGFRYEHLNRHIDYLKRGNSAGDASGRILPSLHVQYALDKKNAFVKGAYSRRINRSNLTDLDPNLIYISDQSYREGDPRLQPIHTDTYEMSYVDSWDWLSSTLAISRTKDSPLSGRFLTSVPGTTTTISQAANFGAKTADDVSLILDARPTTIVRFGATIRLQHISQSYLSMAYNADGTRSSVESTRKGNSPNLQLRASVMGLVHQLQVNANYTGTRIFSTADTGPYWMVMATWSWKLTPRLTLRSSIRDALNSLVFKMSQHSDTVTSNNYSKMQGRIASFSLSYSFGGVTGDPRLRAGGVMLPRPVGLP